MSAILYKIQDNKWIRGIFLVCFLLLFSYQVGKMALSPGNVRLLLSGSFILILFAISRRKPEVALYMLLIFLPFLGLIRRILIPAAGWSSMDPFVVMGPALVLMMTAKWMYEKYIRREAITDDTQLFRLVRWMLLVDVIQIFNPLQGSLFTGIAGAIFYIVPVCFMILGREYFQERWLSRIYATMFIIGILVAIYGFKQFWLGLFPFELAWVELSGYTALQVYDAIRPISTFTNAAEYAHFLGVTAVIGWAYFLRGKARNKILVMIGVGILYAALFVESARGVIVTVTLALTVITMVSAKKAISKVLMSIAAFGILTGLFVVMTKLNTENDLIHHAVIGLTDPFGEQSTLPGHIDLLFIGLIKGITNPVGYGLGSTTIAAGKFAGTVVSSEVDFSNKFLATGIVGGVLYLTIMIKVLFRAMKQVNVGGPIHLIILGILIAEGGSWLTGGHYSVVPLIWLSIGFLDITSARLTQKNSLMNRRGEFT